MLNGDILTQFFFQDFIFVKPNIFLNSNTFKFNSIYYKNIKYRNWSYFLQNCDFFKIEKNVISKFDCLFFATKNVKFIDTNLVASFEHPNFYFKKSYLESKINEPVNVVKALIDKTMFFQTFTSAKRTKVWSILDNCYIYQYNQFISEKNINNQDKFQYARPIITSVDFNILDFIFNINEPVIYKSTNPSYNKFIDECVKNTDNVVSNLKNYDINETNNFNNNKNLLMNYIIKEHSNFFSIKNKINFTSNYTHQVWFVVDDNNFGNGVITKAFRKNLICCCFTDADLASNEIIMEKVNIKKL